MLRRHNSGDLVRRYGAAKGAANPADLSSLRATLAGCWPLLLSASALEVVAYAPRHGLINLRLWLLIGGATLLITLGLGGAACGGAWIASRLRRSPTSPLWPPAIAAAFVSVGALAAELPGRLGVALALVLFSIVFWKLADLAETRGWLGRSATAPLLALTLAAILWSASQRSLVDTGGWVDHRVWVALAVAGYLCLVLTSVVVGKGRVRPLILLMLVAVLSLRLLVRNPADPVRMSPASQASGTPVLLIVLDTLRSDVLDLSDGTAPEIARFAESADVFPDAVANASWTLPAHASILSGLPVSEHRTDATSHPGMTPYLPEMVETLTERLANRGYRTTCVVANGIVGPATGLSRGCQEYENPGYYWLASTYPMRWAKRVARRTDWDPSQLVATLVGRTSYANAREITDRALSYLSAESGEAPAHFLFVNYMDAHRPYAAPAGLGLGRRLSYAFDQFRLLYGDLSFSEFRDRRMETVRDDYRGQVPTIDRQVGRLLEAYESRGWLDEAVVVITADHGQALWENGAIPAYFGHQGGFEPVVRIPLIAKGPHQRTGAVSRERVQQSDLSPWILNALSPDRASGAAAVEWKLTEWTVTEWYPRAARTIAPPVRQRVAIYDGPYKFVREEGGREWLFDVEASPFETEDLLLAEPEVADRLRRLLVTNWAAPGTIDGNGRMIEGDPADDPMIDDALKARLGALGYVR